MNAIVRAIALGSHLFQRVASFLQIIKLIEGTFERLGSHLFQRVASFLLIEFLMLLNAQSRKFSSLSESGFIPTNVVLLNLSMVFSIVLISFREWLHSYFDRLGLLWNQSVVLISFREWLHSYALRKKYKG